MMFKWAIFHTSIVKEDTICWYSLLDMVSKPIIHVLLFATPSPKFFKLNHSNFY